MARKAADYLLTLQGPSGLIRGGPGLDWYSTQHNLLAYDFLGHLALELNAAGDSSGFQKYGSAAATIGSAIESNLIVGNGASTHFIQGLGDTLQSLDVQAYGALFEPANGENKTARRVLSYAKNHSLVTGRSIVKSTEPATYNNTYAASGPFSGYKPYQGDPGRRPLVRGHADAAARRRRPSATAPARSTRGSPPGRDHRLSVGPLQADQTPTDAALGVEYHVWPAVAPAAPGFLPSAERADLFSTSY